MPTQKVPLHPCLGTQKAPCPEGQMLSGQRKRCGACDELNSLERGNELRRIRRSLQTPVTKAAKPCAGTAEGPCPHKATVPAGRTVRCRECRKVARRLVMRAYLKAHPRTKVCDPIRVMERELEEKRQPMHPFVGRGALLALARGAGLIQAA